MKPPTAPFTTNDARSRALTRDLQRAVMHVNAREWAQARACANDVLAASPTDPSALNVLGLVALNTGETEASIGWLHQAAGGQPKNPYIQFNLGEAHRRLGAWREAASFFQRAASLKPDFAEAHAAAGDALRELGKGREAERCYRDALARAPDLIGALHGHGLLLLRQGEPAAAAERFAAATRQAPAGHPLQPLALTNLGLAWLQLGQGLQALTALTQAVQAAPQDPASWRRLAGALRHTRIAPATPAFREILLQLLARADVNPRSLASAAIAVLRQDSEINNLLETIARAPGALPDTLEANAPAAARLVGDRLFQSLLSAAPVPDVAVELLLVQLRADLLRLAGGPSESLDEELGLAIAIARQAFLNEYVLFASAEDQDQVEALIAELDRVDLGRRPGDPTKIAVVAAYRPLTDTPLAARLQAPPSAALAELLHEQLVEPTEEARLRATLPILKAATDATSRAVQLQYEQSPYPRWTRCSLGEPLPFRAAVQLAMPELNVRQIPDLEAPRVLVAGCGTGLETMRVANTFRGASILAVDLSAASLGYALRKTREYGVKDVQHLQADILDLPTLGERFDLIDSFGVLHHMAEPAQGLGVLARLLKPEGLLFVGLYSQIGRRAVVDARDYIARRRFSDDPEGIRGLRRQLMIERPPPVEAVMSPASDFWTLSDCRDLLFHVNEHRFTLPQIGEMLGAVGLEFLGVQFGHAADRTRYLAENTRQGALRDLARLHRHEQEHPEIFGDTYRLWARLRRRSK